MRGILLASATALSFTVFASAAEAATYDFGLIGDDMTYTSNTVNHDGGGTYTDYFTFTTDEALTEYTTASITESPPFQTTSADLTLYSGVVGGPSTELVSSGPFDPRSQATPTISYFIQPGSYFIQDVSTVAAGSNGSYTVSATTSVSAAPEPSIWVMMLLGVGGLGLALRQARRRDGFRVGTALTV